MENNLDIFIGTHKSFTPPVKNEAYKIIVGNHDIDIKTNLEIIKCGNKEDIVDDMFFSEIYMLKKLVDMDYPFKDYVGFCHYRKYFEFMDDIPNVEEVLSEYDCIVAKPIKSKVNMLRHYAINHNIEDIAIVAKIIDKKYQEYSKPFISFLRGNMLIPYNMFIMKRDDFKEYVGFVYGVLNDYVNVVGKNIFKRIVDNKDKYIKKFYPNSTIEYQYRIGGYLAERLTNVFMIKKYNKIKTYPAIITESKYVKKKKEQDS